MFLHKVPVDCVRGQAHPVPVLLHFLAQRNEGLHHHNTKIMCCLVSGAAIRRPQWTQVLKAKVQLVG